MCSVKVPGTETDNHSPWNPDSETQTPHAQIVVTLPRYCLVTRYLKVLACVQSAGMEKNFFVPMLRSQYFPGFFQTLWGELCQWVSVTALTLLQWKNMFEEEVGAAFGKS